jgi:hypothetical protein
MAFRRANGKPFLQANAPPAEKTAFYPDKANQPQVPEQVENESETNR